MIDPDDPMMTADEAAEEPTPSEDMGFCDRCEMDAPESALATVEIERPTHDYPGCYEDWCENCRDDSL